MYLEVIKKQTRCWTQLLGPKTDKHKNWHYSFLSEKDWRQLHKLTQQANKQQFNMSQKKNQKGQSLRNHDIAQKNFKSSRLPKKETDARIRWSSSRAHLHWWSPTGDIKLPKCGWLLLGPYQGHKSQIRLASTWASSISNWAQTRKQNFYAGGTKSQEIMSQCLPGGEQLTMNTSLMSVSVEP